MFRCRLIPLAAMAVAFVLFLSPPLLAHKIKIFATAEGEVINGSGYYPGGGKYRNGPILVYDSRGEIIGKTRTDANGMFSYRPKARQDYTFVISTGDGHRAQYTVPAAELPPSLPPLKGGAGASPSPVAAKAGKPQAAAPEKRKTAAASQEELQGLIDQAVARHIAPLRRQLEGYEQKVRLHDVLGGIGYILGISGVLCYLLARRAKRKNE